MTKVVTDTTFEQETAEGLVLIDFLGYLVWALLDASTNS